MKLNDNTLNILKNFATINTNLIFRPGKFLATKNAAGSINVECVLDQEFEKTFGIYDVSQFLSILNLFDDPELEFTDDCLDVKSMGNVIKVRSKDERVLVVPKKEISQQVKDNFTNSEIQFELNSNLLNLLQKTASVLKSPTLTIKGVDGEIWVILEDHKNSASNNFKTCVGSTEKDFTHYLPKDNLKLLPGTYNVSVFGTAVQFKNKEIDLTYYITTLIDRK